MHDAQTEHQARIEHLLESLKEARTCKWWGEKALIFDGKETPFKECLKTKYGDSEAYVYSIGDAECDEDIDSWEER